MDMSNDEHTARLNSRTVCCCGRPDCAYLEHNNEALRSIERDLDTAARLGQALLNRHESYINESQLEHARLTAQISDLEADRSSLQRANEKIVAENRDLLSQLETLNLSLENSDKHITKLEDLLHDCEEEVRRLGGLERKSKELEEKIQQMEKERIDLTKKVEDEGEEKRNTFRRWRDSERKLQDLRDELDKMEWEARAEKQRHEEVVARLERERALDRELGGAEGRLKGAAAVQSLSKGSGTNVVSHFVRDILQDNANLQAGIVELRELLQASNEEVQNLRDQIIQHQPIEGRNSTERSTKEIPLDEELNWSQPSPTTSQQEVHVHHHYHTKIKPRRERIPSVRRHSRKRTLMSMSTLAATPEASPTAPSSQPELFGTSPIAPLNLYHPRMRRNRWSLQSGVSAISSYPSSPRSYHERNSSIFDRIEFGEESSRPTSPESAAGLSPNQSNWQVDKGNEQDIPFDPSDVSPLNDAVRDSVSQVPLAEEPRPEIDLAHELTPKPSQILNPPDLNPKEIEEALPEHQSHEEGGTTVDLIPDSPPLDPINFDIPIRPSLHRSASHGSLVSISGMDIHIAKRDPPPFTPLRGSSGKLAYTPSLHRKISSTQPLATVTEFTASSINQLPELSPIELDSKKTFTSLEALSEIAGLQNKNDPSVTPQQSSVFGQFVGGWVRGRWGIAPIKSTNDLRAASQRQMPAEIPATPTPSRQGLTSSPFFSRGPGINQKGSIPGIWVPKRTPSDIHPKVMDEEGLREGLAG